MQVLWRALLSTALVAVGLLPAFGVATNSAQAATLSPGAIDAPAPTTTANEVIRGFTVSDDAGIPFYQTYVRFGTDIVGFPISQRFEWNGFTVQAFQKVVMQWQPAERRVDFLNIIDLMGDAGHDGYLQAARSTPPRLPASFDAGLSDFQQIEARRLALLDESPEIAAVFNAAPSAILQFGLPTSRATNNGNHIVMRFQRVIIQHWLEAVPWAAAGQVTIANGGDIAKEVGMLPQAALQPDNGSPSGALPPATTSVTPPATGVTPPATGGTLPTLPSAGGGGGLAPSVAGGMAYGMQIYENADMPRALGMVKGAGFGWVKVQFRWESIEGTRGQINWGYVDNVVNSIAGQGLKPLLSIATTPNWSRAPGAAGNPHGPPNYDDMANFTSAIAARHKGKIGAIEVGNEQNLGREWGEGKVSASEYVKMLCVAYPKIKAADPNIIVISGAPTPTGINEPGNVVDDLTFVRQMYQAGLKNCMDGLGAHPQGYGNAADDDPGRNTKGVRDFIGDWSFYFRRFEQYREVMVQNGDAAHKIWFTEFGSASNPNAHPGHAYAKLNSEQDQAAYIVRAFQIGKERGYIGGMMLWNLNFSVVAEPDDREAKLAYAIIRPDWTPRPAYNAVAAMPK